MTFVNYPGHALAALMAVGAAAFVAYAWRMPAVRKAGLWRAPLAFVLLAVLAGMLVILWNLSRPDPQREAIAPRVLVFFDTSESMSLSDVEKRMTRLDAAVAAFKEISDPLAPEELTFEIYGFDRSVYRGADPTALRRWGKETNLTSVFGRIEEARFAGDDVRPVAGAIVFTDGQAAVKEPTAYPRLVGNTLEEETSFQVSIVGVGAADPALRPRIAALSAPDRVLLGSAYTVEASIEVEHSDEAPLPVHAAFELDGVLIRSTEIGAEDFEAEGGAWRAQVGTQLPAASLGVHALALRATCISGPAGEATGQPSVRETLVEVVEEQPLRVLLYTHTALPAMGKIRQALVRDVKIALDVGFDVIRPHWVRKNRRQPTLQGHVPLPEDAEGFFAYDVIVLGPIDWDALTSRQTEGLYQFVAKRGGGLLILPGSGEYDPLHVRNSFVRALLPVAAADRTENLRQQTAGRPVLTAEGRAMELLPENLLQQLPGTSAPLYTRIELKPAALDLIALEGGKGSATGPALIAMQRLGRGRTALINVAHLYRWYREDMNGGLLRSLLSGLTAGLGGIATRESQIELYALRPAGGGGQVRFDAHVFDQAYKPLSGATVLIETGPANDGGQPLRMDEMEPGRYRAVVNLPHGTWITARAQAEKDGVFLGARRILAHVPPLREEMTDTDLDSAFLRALAARMGGRYATHNELDTKTLLKPPPPVYVERALHTQPLWRTWSALAALCGLLTLYWFTKRMIGLV